MIISVRYTLLNHLFYYTELAGGQAASTVTGAFLGDIALTYALAESIGVRDEKFKHRLSPEYKEEMSSFKCYCSVGKPVQEASKTRTYIHNTLFTDGYPDLKAIELAAKTPYKTYRQVQGLSIGTSFTGLVFSEDPIHIPAVIRVGRQRETLVKVDAAEVTDSDRFWLNAYTLKAVFGNLDKAIEVITGNPNVNTHFMLAQYYLIKNLSLTEVKEIFSNRFHE